MESIEGPFQFAVSDVSAVVCTRNSHASIRRCLSSLRQARVKEIIVVDAQSVDGTPQVAKDLADFLIADDGSGLGNARNLGIARSSGRLILNMGSDNVLLHGELNRMIQCLELGGYSGVSAQTLVEGDGYIARGLNAWRAGRFRPGDALVIGTPTLFIGDTLRRNPYDSGRKFSDDSELCTRWNRDFGSRFAICDARVLEIGKASWSEVKSRCTIYGISDYETYQTGKQSDWGLPRRVKSLMHPFRVDIVDPLRNLPKGSAIAYLPFLMVFAALRYLAWARRACCRA